MQLNHQPVRYTESGYRLQSAEAARNGALDALSRHAIACEHIPLGEYCDLGFHADCFVGHKHERDCGVGNHLHFGKGFTPLQSMVSGMYETIERASSYINERTISVRGSYHDLRRDGYPVIDPAGFALPDATLVGRDDLYLSTVHSAYDADLPLDWVGAWSVLDQSYVYMPICFVYSIPHDDRANNICHNRPNGLSSGTCIEEAVLGGLFELIERDACCLFAVHSLPLPTVENDSIEIESVRTFLDRATKGGVDVTIKNCTTSLGVPAFCTFLHDSSPSAPRASSGAGAHQSKEIALVRSVAEACLERAVNVWQLPNLRLLRTGDVPGKIRWEAEQYWGKILGTGGWCCDYARRHKRTELFGSLPSSRFDDLRDAIDAVLRVLAARGVERIYIADLSIFDIPTVRVIAPDLEFAPKALYRITDGERERARRIWKEPAEMGYVEGADFIFLEGLGNDHLL